MTASRFAVIGAGLAGASTAWRLAEDGHEVVLLERSEPANRWGSSHGSARIFRYTYPDAFYTRLVAEAKIGWDDIELRTGASLLTPSGALDFGSSHDPASLARILNTEGIANELMSPAAAQSRWPQFSFDSDVLWHEAASVIDAENAVHSIVALAERSGARIERNWEVIAVDRVVNGYRMTSTDGRVVDSENVIVAAGGWLPTLLPGLPLSSSFVSRMPALAVRQEQTFHFEYRDDFADDRPSGRYGWPAFIHHSGDVQTYGLPGGRDAEYRGQKVSRFNGGKDIGSAEKQDGIVNAANREFMIEYVRRYIPGLIPEPYAESTCLFTNTPTEDFFIDSERNLTVVSPCSGHGAKFAPAIGRIVADFVTGTTEVDRRFRLG